jgi:hypothetical protein
MPGATQGVGANGGIVASFDTTNAQKTNTGNNVWYTGDFDTADQILACGIQKGLWRGGQRHVHPRPAASRQGGRPTVTSCNSVGVVGAEPMSHVPRDTSAGDVFVTLL